MSEEILINGKKITELSDMFFEYCKLKKETERLQEENEKIKKQYNCYACGNCNGKEDYINLEKHHKGLRKQFNELAKRNNTLSLRIEELEKENEELKKRQITKNGFICDCEQNTKYKQVLEEIKEHIKGLEKLLFENTYADDTKRLIMVELQTLRAVLEDSEDENS